MAGGPPSHAPRGEGKGAAGPPPQARLGVRVGTGAAGAPMAEAGLDLLDTLAEVIDTRSFSSVWYWIAVATVWSSATHWILGVPWDVVHRARTDPAGMPDLEDVARINVNRMLRVARSAGAVATGATAALLTLLGITGFVYGAEFAQAVFLVALPLSVAALLSARAARRIAAASASGSDLVAMLVRLRRQMQGLSVAAIFVSAMYGMLWNLAMRPPVGVPW